MSCRTLIGLVNAGLWRAEERDRLLSSIRGLLSEMCVVIDVRVGSRRLEVDAFVDRERLPQVISKLRSLSEVEYVRELSADSLDEEDPLRVGVEFFNDERYWEAHETWEGVWRNSTGGEKEAVSALILVAAAYVHLQRGRAERYFSVLRRAMEKLERLSVQRIGHIDLGPLRREVQERLSNRCVRAVRIGSREKLKSY
ncbi:MAG: DUF309 domain-containing protein [Aigarchaeota archaeon]|nr:DUF309 domain-containing protein [Aigarchaeota archaeon]MDW8092741.1 DUF309 domain-containing protein [Nitrososphaerota archaeon]